MSSSLGTEILRTCQTVSELEILLVKFSCLLPVLIFTVEQERNQQKTKYLRRGNNQLMINLLSVSSVSQASDALPVLITEVNSVNH